MRRQAVFHGHDLRTINHFAFEWKESEKHVNGSALGGQKVEYSCGKGRGNCGRLRESEAMNIGEPNKLFQAVV